jgi:hypothetical protein
MRFRYPVSLLLAAAVAACSGESGTTAPTVPLPPAPAVLLRDVQIPNLPSPFYQFEYDASGRVKTASFASGLRVYDVTYDGDRISEMHNDAVGNRDKLLYSYDNAGRVNAIRYVDPNGVVFTKLAFSYTGQKLTGIERQRLLNSAFVIDKTTSLSYYPDGNLLEITEHRPAVVGQQDETTGVDRFELYDDKTNVDGFSLLHPEFFDHLVLLPGVQLQKGNPGREIRTGDGINFTVDYSYTYDDRNRPLTKSGAGRLSNGADAGQQFQTRSVFSYF